MTDPTPTDGEKMEDVNDKKLTWPGERVRHRKGAFYTVVGVATHSETGEQLMVYQDADQKRWARPLPMFLDGRFTLSPRPVCNFCWEPAEEEDDACNHCGRRFGSEAEKVPDPDAEGVRDA